MTIEIRVGPQYEYASLGEDEGARVPSLSNSYGYLTDGTYTTTADDFIEITYRALDISSGSNLFFLDGPDAANRGYLIAQVPSGNLFSGYFYDVEIDSITASSVPSDTDVHTISGKYIDAGKRVYYLGTSYSSLDCKSDITIESFKINGVAQSITWVNTITVGGQSETKAEIDQFFLTLALVDSYLDGMSVAESYNVQWMARVASGTIVSELTFNINMNGNELLLDGENKTTIDDQYGNGIADLIAGYGRVINMMGIDNSPLPDSSRKVNSSRRRKVRMIIAGY